MTLFTDKKALLKKGHLILSVLALILAYYIANYTFKIPVFDIINKNLLLTTGLLIVYFFFSILVDKIEKGGYDHRSILHSKFMVACCLISIPLTIMKGIEYSSGWFFITVAIIAHLLHIFYDTLSSSIPNFF